MNRNNLLLVVSPTLRSEDLMATPFNLDPESFLVTGYASLGFIGLESFSSVVFHDPPPDFLRKLQLGIRDSRELEGAWKLFAYPGRRSIRILVPAPVSPPPQVWRDLSIEPVFPRDLATAIPGNNEVFTSPGPVKPAVPLTGDDIREMHRKGVRELPPGSRLTDWGREVADTLGMTVRDSSPCPLLIALSARTTKALRAASEFLFSSATAHPEALFVVVPTLIPIFRELFPSLKNRMVSPVVHWAAHGAFTGEVSLDLLIDMGCAGAILQDDPPHNLPKNREGLIRRAGEKGFRLFSPSPLAAEKACDIITAPGRVQPSGLQPVRFLDRRGTPDWSAESERSAVLVGEEEISGKQRKGQDK